MEGKDPTRREFVKTTGAAVAATAASAFPAPAIQKVRAANDQVLFGMIGTGSRGTYLLRHLTKIDSGRCVAVCDVYDGAVKAGIKDAGTNPKGYKDYRELLARKDIDAVIVTTPLYMHFPVTRDVLLAGKHVFCEKSLVFKPEESIALKALAQERPKQVLQVGLQRRYSTFYRTAKAMIDKGMLGTVTHVRAQWHRNTFAKDPWNKPVPAGRTDKDVNWRKYREFSGGLTAELGSHQIDVADWMFGMHPEFVVGVGGTNWIKDGRDIYDNVQLIFQYPKGQKLVYTSITTNRHLSLFGGTRTEFGECIMGTEGSIEITVGTDNEPAIGMWYYEPKPQEVTQAQTAKKEQVIAGASLASTGSGAKGFPILLPKDQFTGKESFLAKEMKFARRWLYSKGVMVPEEEQNPVDVSLASFFDCVRNGKRPSADLEVGLADSASVMLSNRAMDEGRRVYFDEIEKMGLGEAQAARRG